MLNSAAMKKRLWFAYFVALVCWSINSYVLLFAWLAQGTMFARTMDNGGIAISDFVNVYDAGILGLKAKTCKIYDPDLQAETAKQTIAPIKPELPFYLQAPPFFFVCCIPLAFLSVGWAWALYCFVALSACTAAVYALTKTYPEFGSGFKRSFLYLAVFSSFPAWLGVRLGNTSLFLFPGLTLFFLLLKSKRYFAAGLATACLMIKVQYLPYVVIIGFILGRMRYLYGAALAGALVVAISILVLGWDNVIDWPLVLLSAETTRKFGGVEPENMQNIRGMLVALCQNQELFYVPKVAGACFALGAMALAFLWFKPYVDLSKRSAWSFEICAALSTLMMVILSVHTHSQDYFVMSFVGPLLFASCVESPGSAAFQAAENEPPSAPTSPAISPARERLRMLLVFFPPLSWAFFITKQQLKLLPIQPFAVYAILLCICILFLWFKTDKKNASINSL